MSLLRREPKVAADASVALQCPRDETPLAPRVVAGVTLDQCGTCGGTWFDAGELKRVTGERRIEKQATRERIVPLSSDFACPRCAGPCNLSYIEEVPVDACTKCRGIWLDAGEVEEAKRQVEVRRIMDEMRGDFRSFLVRL